MTSLLDQEWADVDELCTAVFAHVTDALLARDWWVLGAAHAGTLMVYGPYSSKTKAIRGVTDIQLHAESTRVVVRKLVTVGDMEDDDYA